MKTITKIGVVGGLVAALAGCSKSEYVRGFKRAKALALGVVCFEENKANITLEDVRAFYREALPGLRCNAYSTEVFDKQGVFLGEIVLVDSNRLNEGVYQHGWFECPAGCKAIVGEDGSVYIKLGGN